MTTTPAGEMRHRLGADETIPDDQIESIAIDLEAAVPRFRELVERAHRNGLRIVVTRHGEEIAAILPAEDLHGMEEFEDRRDSELADQALEEAEREGTIPWARVKAELDAQAAQALPGRARHRQRPGILVAAPIAPGALPRGQRGQALGRRRAGPRF